MFRLAFLFCIPAVVAICALVPHDRVVELLKALEAML